ARAGTGRRGAPRHRVRRRHDGPPAARGDAAADAVRPGLDRQRAGARGRRPCAACAAVRGPARPELPAHAGQRHALVPPHPPAWPPLPRARPQRPAGAAHAVARHSADGAGGAGGDRFPRRQPGRLDAALPRARAPRRRHGGRVPGDRLSARGNARLARGSNPVQHPVVSSPAIAQEALMSRTVTAALVAASLLAACAAPLPPPPVLPAFEGATPPAPGQARLYVFRPRAEDQALHDEQPVLFVDGAPVTALPENGYADVQLPAGRHVLSFVPPEGGSDLWRSTMTLRLPPGSVHYVAVWMAAGFE